MAARRKKQRQQWYDLSSLRCYDMPFRPNIYSHFSEEKLRITVVMLRLCRSVSRSPRTETQYTTEHVGVLIFCLVTLKNPFRILAGIMCQKAKQKMWVSMCKQGDVMFRLVFTGMTMLGDSLKTCVRMLHLTAFSTARRAGLSY